MYRLKNACVAATAIASFALVGCGPDAGSNDTSKPPTTAESSTPVPASSPNPKTAPPNDSFTPRFDGLYFTPLPDGKAKRHFVRFFKNGTICLTWHDDGTPPDNIRKWLKPGHRQVGDECSITHDTKESFTVHQDSGTIDYTVRRFDRANDSFDLKSLSHIDGFEGVIREKHFTFSKD
jgi:hypothetical protein